MIAVLKFLSSPAFEAWYMIAVAIGTIIMAVAVLLIHAEMKAVAAMNPAIDLASQDIPSMSESRMNKKSTGPSTRPAFRLEIIGSLKCSRILPGKFSGFARLEFGSTNLLLRSHYQNRSVCPSYHCTGCTSYQ